jgi:hypothetical protein
MRSSQAEARAADRLPLRSTTPRLLSGRQCPGTPTRNLPIWLAPRPQAARRFDDRCRRTAGAIRLLRRSFGRRYTRGVFGFARTGASKQRAGGCDPTSYSVHRGSPYSSTVATGTAARTTRPRHGQTPTTGRPSSHETFCETEPTIGPFWKPAGRWCGSGSTRTHWPGPLASSGSSVPGGATGLRLRLRAAKGRQFSVALRE